MSRAEMDALGWDVDIIIVTGDAYIDHLSWRALVAALSLWPRDSASASSASPDWDSAADAPAPGRLRCSTASPLGTWDLMVKPPHRRPQTLLRRRSHPGRTSPTSARPRGGRLFMPSAPAKLPDAPSCTGSIRGQPADRPIATLLVREGASLGAARSARLTCWCSVPGDAGRPSPLVPPLAAGGADRVIRDRAAESLMWSCRVGARPRRLCWADSTTNDTPWRRQELHPDPYAMGALQALHHATEAAAGGCPAGRASSRPHRARRAARKAGPRPHRRVVRPLGPTRRRSRTR